VDGLRSIDFHSNSGSRNGLPRQLDILRIAFIRLFGLDFRPFIRINGKELLAYSDYLRDNGQPHLTDER